MPSLTATLKPRPSCGLDLLPGHVWALNLGDGTPVIPLRGADVLVAALLCRMARQGLHIAHVMATRAALVGEAR